MRNVWEISAPTAEEKKFGKHPTQKPVELLTRVLLASTREGDLVLDPFCGSSTTGVAAIVLNRQYVGIDLESEYLHLSRKRLEQAIKEKQAPLCLQGENKNEDRRLWRGHHNNGVKL